jgi:hypothetical protein
LSTIGLRKEERKKDNSTFFTVGEGSKRIVIILTIALIVIIISVSITVLPGTNTNSDAFTKCKESALGYEQ